MNNSALATTSGQQQYKIVVLGAGAVGKSSLTVRYITDDFLDEYDPTIEDYYHKLVDVDDDPALMDILDTAGQDEFSCMQDEFFRQGRGFILVYSIISRDTFEHVRNLREKILRARGTESKLAIVIAGNKCDLHNKRNVTTEEGQNLAKEWECVFYETSAKDKINNSIIFQDCVREIRKLEGINNPQKNKKPLACLIL